MQNKSIKLNAILNGTRTILNVIFPLITFPYISRVLSTEEIGKYNFSGSIVSYFMLIAALGFSQYAVREGAKYRSSKEELSIFASEVFSLNVISTIVSYLLLILVVIISTKLHDYFFCIAILSTQIFFTTIGFEWVYSIFEEYTYITVRSIVFKIISIILLFLFVKKEGDYLIYTAISVVACVGSNILNLFNCKKYCNIKLSFKFDWKPILIPILIIFASNIAIQIYVNSDMTMLGYMKDDYSVGIYSVSTKIYAIVKNVLTAVLTVTIPRFSLYAGKGLKEEYDILLLKVINTLILVCIPAIVGLMVLNHNVIFVIAGEKYGDASASLCILCGAIVFAVFNGLFNTCVLLAYKREMIFLKCTIISALLNILLNFIFIPWLSEVGASITTLVSEAVLCIMLYISSKDLIGRSFIKKESIKNYISVIVSSACIVIICIIVNNNISNVYVATIISVVFSVITYAAVLLILKNWIALSFFNGVKQKILRK